MDVASLIERDEWKGIAVEKKQGPGLLRWRVPVLQPGDGDSHPTLIQVVWPYAEQGSAAMPSDQLFEELRVFEDRLCAAWEQDALAVLTAVLTFDGAKQWVFYTNDVQACTRRLNEMPQVEQPYPIEVTARPDGTWAFLRDEILRTVDTR
ncbi:DUF695 domain-containing protein [Pelagibius sp.]|uniref:DUF695 domain-containing protein n=1 Tax=Pelagibius sp. TaxID=1931238 RepID=UPI00261F843F|nr:DUF695 domain-containing protein [Pelagibius sp.]